LVVTPNLKTSKIFKKKIKNTILIMRPEVASALFFFSLQRVQRDDFTGRPNFFFDFYECESAVLFFVPFETIALFFDTKRAKTPACGPETNFSPGLRQNRPRNQPHFAGYPQPRDFTLVSLECA
jgi:hypothetical protein